MVRFPVNATNATNRPNHTLTSTTVVIVIMLRRSLFAQPCAAIAATGAAALLAPTRAVAARGALTSQTVREALNHAILEEMDRDKSVIILGEEVGKYDGAYKVSKGLLNKFDAHRVIDTPITEYGFTGMAVGAALKGMRPIVEYMSFNFAMQACDHIINSAAKGHYMSGGQLKCPIVFRGANGASSGVGAQHSQCFASFYAQVPGLLVVAPYDVTDARGLLKAAVRDPNPVIVLEHELMYGASFEVGDDVLDHNFTLPLGKAHIARPGTDITIVAFSRAVGLSLTAAQTLQSEFGISAEVINLRSLRPIDRDTIIASVKKTGRIMTVDESFPVCNIGAEIAAIIMESEAFDYLDAPLERVSCADVPMPYATHLEMKVQPQPADIVTVARCICERKMYSS